ncbi:heme detoxification protein [Cystoisospora suis]|uniref:Heme detoxification protein n=1 Tax=Cystoisospora suis TaxID=483139 RepID=A0A2C6KQZ1_9APIC|nr:heme detoxification protein [Cystoisospora suis]
MRAVKLSGLPVEVCGGWKGREEGPFTCKVRSLAIRNAGRGINWWRRGSSVCTTEVSVEGFFWQRSSGLRHLFFRARGFTGVSGHRRRDKQAGLAPRESRRVRDDSQARNTSALLGSRDKLSLTDHCYNASSPGGESLWIRRSKATCLKDHGNQERRMAGKVMKPLTSDVSGPSGTREPWISQLKSFSLVALPVRCSCFSSVPPPSRPFRGSNANAAVSLSPSGLRCPALPPLRLPTFYSCRRNSYSSHRCCSSCSREAALPFPYCYSLLSWQPLLSSSCLLCVPGGARHGTHTEALSFRDARLPCFPTGQDGVLTCLSSRDRLGFSFLQRRWWTRCSGMRKPVKWSKDWEVLNRKVYYAFDEKDIRRSLLDTLSAHRKTASIFYKVVNLVPALIHTLSLPGPYTFFVPTDAGCYAHLTPQTMRALKEKISLLEEQQRQRYASTHQLLPPGVPRASGGTQACTASPIAAKALAKAGGLSFPAPAVSAHEGGKAGTAAASAAASRAADQLRTFVLAHVIAGEWRLKPLLMAARKNSMTPGSCAPNCNPEYLAPVMYASRLALSNLTTASGSSAMKDESVRREESPSCFLTSPEITQESGHFELPQSLSGGHGIRVDVRPSQYAAVLPITTSTNFTEPFKARDENRQIGNASETRKEVSLGPENRSFARVGGAAHIWVSGALITRGDLRAHNGVMHLVDRPTVPSCLSGASSS